MPICKRRSASSREVSSVYENSCRISFFLKFLFFGRKKSSRKKSSHPVFEARH